MVVGLLVRMSDTNGVLVMVLVVVQRIGRVKESVVK